MRTSMAVLAGAVSLALLASASAVTIAVAEDEEPPAADRYLAGELNGLMTADYDDPLACAPWVLPDGTELPSPTLSHRLVGETTLLGPTTLEARNCMTFSAPLEDVPAGTFVMLGEDDSALSGSWSGDCAPGLVDIGKDYRCTGLFEITQGTDALTGVTGRFRAMADFVNAGFTYDGVLRDTPTRWFIEGMLDGELMAASWSRVATTTPAWADDDGWGDPTNHETMRVVPVGDHLFLLGRTAHGVDTWRFDTTLGAWAQVADNVPAWSDDKGWVRPQYYDTMRVAVAGDDLYLLARTSDGVDTWRFDTVTGSWSQVGEDRPAWTDDKGWNEAPRYESLRVAALGDDLYLLARSVAGIDTWRFDGETDTWSQVSDDRPAWSDDKGWNEVANYDTMRVAVAGDDLYLLARTSYGVDTWRFDTGTERWMHVGDDTPAWTDADGWTGAEQYPTMRLAAVGDDLYLLGRTVAGIDTWRFDTVTERWTQASSATPPWSNAAGFDDVANLSTMRLEVVGEGLYLLVRTADGVDAWRFDTETEAWTQMTDDDPELADARGWNDATNYATIRTAVADGALYLAARSDNGVETWRLDMTAGDDPDDE